MKRKMLMITAMLAVMIAMTGIAAADDIILDFGPPGGSGPVLIAGPAPVALVEGGTATGNVKYTGIDPGPPAGSYMIDWQVFNKNFMPTSEIVANDGDAAGPDGGLDATIGSYLATDGVFHTITIKDVPGVNSYDKYYLRTCVNGGLCNFYSITLPISYSIPEFPTVALPIAAVIGLMYVFNSRKKEEE